MISAPYEQAQNISKISAVRHGFFGCIGLDKNDDFNCSLTVGGQQEQAKTNRNIAKKIIAGKNAKLTYVHQTHTSYVVTIDRKTPVPQEADALVTSTRNIALSILTADCCPILFADEKTKIIGAAHAGWQGAVNGIIANTIKAMVDLGAKKENIIAAFGPTISSASYEIGTQRAKDIIKANQRAEQFIFIPKNSQREHFDLPNFVFNELKIAGVKNIEQAGGCTANNPTKYFSHRYASNNKATQGRQISIISLQ